MAPTMFGGSSPSKCGRVGLCATAVALVLTGCLGAHDSSAHVTGIGSGAGGFDSHRGAPAVPIEGAVRGGTVTVLMSGDLGHSKGDFPVQTLDPTGSYFTDTS